MITLLSRLFIKNREQTDNPTMRQAYGVLCGGVGIFLNLLLFTGKLIAGTISASIAITADAFNNLSDAGSSIITLIGFKLSGQKPDHEHPFGHGRMEYVSGLLVSVAILVMGFELAKSSLEKIIHPEEISFSWLILGILIASILVKVYMAIYNTKTAKKIKSTAMKATATDSLNDCISTGVVLVVTVISYLTHWQIDGWCGLFVAVFILFSGTKAIKETISPLLGQPPTKEFVGRIETIVSKEPQVLGLHDLVVHDYGPGRCMVSLHAEVDAHSDMMTVHDAIDNLERELNQELGCHTVIHMDPIDTQNEQITQLKCQVKEQLATISPQLTLHDFRMVPGPTHTNLIFDVVMPFDFAMTEVALKTKISELVKQMPGNFYAVVDVDQAYVDPQDA